MADYEDGIFSNLPRPRRRRDDDDDAPRLSPRQLLAMNFVPEGPLPQRPRPSSRKGGSSPSGPHAPVISAAPVVTGAAAVSQTLTCSTGTWLYVPTSYTYQWLRDGATIAGATSATYLTLSGDLTHAISCAVTAINATGNASATSNALTIVAVPANTTAPVVSGATTVPSTLSCTTGTWSNSPTSYAYQWVRGASNISGATSATYFTVSADNGTSLTCVVTASNAAGSASATSNALSIGAGGHSAQALAYLARTVGGNEGGNATNIANLIDGLVSDGVWAQLDALYVLAQQNQTDALLNLVGTSYTLPSSVGTFTTYVGFSAFPTTGGMDTGFNPSTAPSPNYVINSASAGVWVYEADTNGGVQIGTGVGGLVQIVSNFNLGGQFQFNLNCSGPTMATPGTTGLFVGDTSTVTLVHPYWNGVDKGVQSGSGAGVPNATIKIGGAPGGWQVNKNLSVGFIGGSLGAAGQLALYNRLRTYLTAVGVP